MSALAAPPVFSPPSPSIPTEMLWRLSVAKYHEMIRAGILTTEDRLELVHGYLVQKMTKKPPHTLSTELTRDALVALLPVNFFVNSQEPVTTTDSEPEPDAAIIRGDRRQFRDDHPQPSDVLLIVEVADSSLEYDRRIKKRLYAENSIPTYWIVNLVDNQVEVYTDPTGPTAEPDYRSRQDYLDLDEVPVVIDGQEIGRLPVRDLLP
jgi:Uma2 family endonuclease